MEDVLTIVPEIIEFRRDLHENPSPSGQEQDSCRRIAARLDKYGIKYEMLLDGCAICAQVGTGKEPCIGLRGDIDALPVTEATGLRYSSKNQGYMHACGHDIHTAVLLGVAILAKQKEAELKGTLKFFFQPAEETTGGAERMIKAGVLENPYVKNVLGLHVAPTFDAGKAGFKFGQMMAASDEFTLHIRGKGSHGAHPDLGVDTIVMASQIVTALQTITSRNLAPYDAGIVTVGSFHAGTAGNVIPETAELVGIMRSLTEETRKLLRRRVRDVAEGVAKGFGGEAELEIRPSYTALICDNNVTKTVKNVAEELLGEENVIEEDVPSLGTEDFSYFAQARPSCYWHLGCGIRGEDNAPVHNEKFCADEACIPVGIGIQLKSALQLLKAEE